MLASEPCQHRRAIRAPAFVAGLSPDLPGDRPRPQSAAPYQSVPNGRTLAGVRVLVVEDEIIVALDLVQMLEELGADVCGTAASGTDALRKARALQPDMAIVDVRLKDGETGIDAARAMTDELGIAIVFATAHTDPTLTARMGSVFGSRHLTKPYTARELAQATHSVLRRQ